MKRANVKDWNYRVFKSGDFFGIVEVYYDTAGKPIGFSDYNYPFGYSEGELKLDISSMLKAFRLPVLSQDDFEKKSVRKNKIVVPSVKNPPNKETMMKGNNNV